MILNLEEVMTSPVLSVSDADSIYKARKKMEEIRARHIPVINSDKELVGLLTKRDLLSVNFSSLSDIDFQEQEEIQKKTPVKEVMNKKVVSVSRDHDLLEAAEMMLQNKYGCLPIVDSNNELAGIITEADFVFLTIKLLELAERQKNIHAYTEGQ